MSEKDTLLERSPGWAIWNYFHDKIVFDSCIPGPRRPGWIAYDVTAPGTRRMGEVLTVMSQTLGESDGHSR